MPVSKKPKKKYRPKYERGQLPITIRHSTKSEIALQITPQTEIDRLRDGTANEITLNTLTFRLNWGYVMAGEYFNEEEAREKMLKALAAIRSVKERYERLGKVGATQPEYEDIGEGLNFTDEMQLLATRREQRDALRIVDLVNQDKHRTMEVSSQEKA